MSPPQLILSNEAQDIFNQAMDRAAQRAFLGWEISAQEEAEQNILQSFYEAAGINDIATGVLPPRDRVLDASEARLALAALNLNSGGASSLISSGEALAATENLRDAFLYLTYLATVGGHTDQHALAQAIRRDAMDRAQGWRRISDQTVSREISGMFRSQSVQDFDRQPGLSPIDGLLVYLYLNDEVGSDTASIGFTESMYVFNRLEGAL